MCIDYRFSKPVVFYRGVNVVNIFVKAIFKEMNCCKQIIKSHFNKNFIMSVEDEERFQSRNKCLICNKLTDAGDNKRCENKCYTKWVRKIHCLYT